MVHRSRRAKNTDWDRLAKAEQDARAKQFRAQFTVITSKGHSRREPEPTDRWLMLADKLLDTVREEQRRVKEKIKPHVERYQNITGNKE